MPDIIKMSYISNYLKIKINYIMIFFIFAYMINVYNRK